MRWFTLFLPLLAACPGVTEPRVTDTELDRGRLCFDSQGALQVDFQTCLGGCDTLAESSCEAVFEGDTLVVDAYARIETESGPGVACTDICNLAIVTCEVPDDLDPTTPVEHAESTGTVADIQPCEIF